MIRRVILCLLTLSLLVPALADAATRVRGYYRKNGTYVAPHYRSNPDGNPYNNWSTRGNVNPYTGAIGTKNPAPPTRPMSPAPQAPSSYGHRYVRDWSQELFDTPALPTTTVPTSQPTMSDPPYSQLVFTGLSGGSRTRQREYCFQRARLAQYFAEGRDMGLAASEMFARSGVRNAPPVAQEDVSRIITAVYAAPVSMPSEVLQIMGESCFHALGVE